MNVFFKMNLSENSKILKKRQSYISSRTLLSKSLVCSSVASHLQAAVKLNRFNCNTSLCLVKLFSMMIFLELSNTTGVLTQTMEGKDF